MSTPADAKNEMQERLRVLRTIIREGEPSTQEELSEALLKKGFEVTQSTISRDLRRLGAVKITNAEEEIVYVLPEDHELFQRVTNSLDGLVMDVVSNESLIVLHTTPGAASLVARHLDSLSDTLGILGCIAGDDTIMVVPESVKKIAAVMRKIKDEFF